MLRGDDAIGSMTLSLNYRCNSRCSFCFIEPEIGMGLPPTPREQLDAILAENRARGRYRRLILAGAEATLLPELLELVVQARAEGGVDHVRLQTNGRRLADEALLDALIAAGVDEFFVSVHAPDAARDHLVTRSRASFDQMLAGLRNLLDRPVRTMSNTVVSRSTHLWLPELADLLLVEGVREAHFWAFLEFGDIGQAAEHVAFADSVPPLLEAVRKLDEAGRAVVLSWFPQCLLGPWARLLVNHRDDTQITEHFSRRVHEAGRFGCPHACPALGRSCYGLHPRHVAVIGDEAAILSPVER